MSHQQEMGHMGEANPDVLVLLRQTHCPDDTEADPRVHDLGLWR